MLVLWSSLDETALMHNYFLEEMFSVDVESLGCNLEHQLLSVCVFLSLPVNSSVSTAFMLGGKWIISLADAFLEPPQKY